MKLITNLLTISNARHIKFIHIWTIVQIQISDANGHDRDRDAVGERLIITTILYLK